MPVTSQKATQDPGEQNARTGQAESAVTPGSSAGSIIHPIDPLPYTPPLPKLRRSRK